jgi:RND family efflux transporter MFP subunit
MSTNFKALIAVAMTASLLGACAEESGSPTAGARQAAPAIPVIAEPISFENANTMIESVGTSRAILSAELHPADSGEVVAVNVEPGQFVRKGTVLMQLDSREQALAVKLAKLKLEDAQRLFDRYQRSADSGAVLPTTLDAARTAVELARVELESAEIAFQDRTVRAVFDGHVGTTDVDLGDRVGPDSIVTTLDDRSALLVSFDVPEQFLGDLVVGDSVRLETWSSALPAVTGEIVDIGSRVDRASRSFVARARVANDDDTLRPGMSFKVQAQVEGQRYAVVAETGVQWGADGAYIWAVVDGMAQRVSVQVIQRREGRVLIDGDFDAGFLVVVEGTQSIRDGIAVNVDEDHLARMRAQQAGPGSIS